MSGRTKTNEFADDLKKAVEVLKRGGIILYPSDTIWGLGCDATRQDAVERIFSIKRREDGSYRTGKRIRYARTLCQECA